MAELFVCELQDISDGEVRIVGESGQEIGVIKHNGEFFAYLNRCPHQGGPVCEGLRLPQVCDMIDEQGSFVGQRFDHGDMHIVCPWHGYEYHLKTGVHAGDPRVKLKRFEVISRDGGLYVLI